jgi:anti-sigma factor RsiW
MQHQDPAGSWQHPQHDPFLIAGLAADDLSPAERTRATALTDACAACEALHADLRALAQATRTLPAPPAPRDFRITADQAARLRRTGWLATLLRPFTGVRSPARPLATTFTTLGLIGVFVATVLPGIAGGAASMTAPEADPGAAGAPAFGAGATAAPAPQLGPASSAGADDGVGTKDNVEASAAPGVAQAGGDRDLGSDTDGRIDDPTPANLMLIGSGALLAAGIVLFGLRLAARRLR